MDSTSVITQAIQLWQLHSWVTVLGVVLLLGTFIPNRKWGEWGYAFGQKMALVKQLSPVVHGLAQLTGWLGMLLTNIGLGLEGKEPLLPKE